MFGYHPNLTYQADIGRAQGMFDETANEVYGDVSNCPRTVGAVVLGMLVGAILLKAMGFQFAIGVGK